MNSTVIVFGTFSCVNIIVPLNSPGELPVLVYIIQPVPLLTISPPSTSCPKLSAQNIPPPLPPPHTHTHPIASHIRGTVLSYAASFFPPAPGEDIWQTAIRETLEETGIQTEFVSLLCFRHMHGYRWGTDDLYFACLLHPLNTDITISPSEIADAKWMDVRLW